jgi:hypothetical protein
MSIADILIYTIDWIFQNTLLQILPTNAAGMSFDALTTTLTSFENTIIGSLSGFGFIAPVALILSLIVIIFTAEFTLFGFHIFIFIVKLIRG